MAGTGGVVAFVGILLVACRSAGFRLRPRHPRGDPRVVSALRHSAWGAVLHTGAGALLGAAVVAGSGVEGAVVAYQVAWVFFLAPYGILLFATNLRNFRLDRAELGSLAVKDISRATLAFDCERGANRHHVFQIERRAG